MNLLSHGLKVTQCDGCDKRQLAGDQFDPFYISYPAGFHAITGEPMVKFLYESVEPLRPRQYHACPVCAAKVRRALKRNLIGLLPDGRLRADMLATRSRVDNPMRAFQIIFLRQSLLGEATA